jgi:hypothetical protein
MAQKAGGTDDVMRIVDCLDRADLSWCAIEGVPVNHFPLFHMKVYTYSEARQRLAEHDVEG